MPAESKEESVLFCTMASLRYVSSKSNFCFAFCPYISIYTLLYIMLCLALDCMKLYREVVIRAELSCCVYLSGVNTLQGNEGGQE